MYVERILPCVALWSSIVEKSTKFFQVVILPELIFKYLSRQYASHDKTILQDNENKLKSKIGNGRENKKMTAIIPRNNKRRKKPEPCSSRDVPVTISQHDSQPGSHPTSDSPSSHKSEEEDLSLFCVCSNKTKVSRMIACDSPDCPHIPFEWFHFSCMKLRKVPKGKWFCPDCREMEAMKKIRGSSMRSAQPKLQ